MIVCTAAITSNDPLSTQLLYKFRSYSQMAVAFSTAAILVMWPITSMLARLTTCSRQLVNVHCLSPKLLNLKVNHLQKLIVGCTSWFVSSSDVKRFNGCTDCGVVWGVVKCDCVKLNIFRWLRNKQTNNQEKLAFDLSVLQTPTWSHKPTKYCPRFQPLCSPKIPWNPTTSECKLYFLLSTSIQCAVIPRYDTLLLSAVQPSAVNDILPGAF